jgi:hypothetical protein
MDEIVTCSALELGAAEPTAATKVDREELAGATDSNGYPPVASASAGMRWTESKT